MTGIENAIITKTELGYAGGNIPTFYVHVEGNGWGCGIGGYSICGYDAGKKDETYSGAALEAIMNICKVVGVKNWEDLKGKYCRVEIESMGKGVHMIGNIIKNDWFDIKEFYERVREEKG